jgi:hypothetical protein
VTLTRANPQPRADQRADPLAVALAVEIAGRAGKLAWAVGRRPMVGR